MSNELFSLYNVEIANRMYIRKVSKDIQIKGFTCLKGSYVLYLDGHAVAFASGWHGGGYTFVYRVVNGSYIGDWVDTDNSDARGIFAAEVYWDADYNEKVYQYAKEKEEEEENM